MIPCILAIAMFYIFNMQYNDSWGTIIMYPFGCTGFTYLTSYLFGTEQSAQSITLFTHIIFGAIGGMTIFILLIIPGATDWGDNLKWVFKIIPTFSISNTIIYDAAKTSLNSTRTLYRSANIEVNDLTLEGFDFQNIGGDMFFLGMHFIVAVIGIAVLELGLLNCLARTNCRKSKAPIE